jgi:hypothetical protein
MMSDIEIQINELLDTTIMMCDEVAAQVGCPVEWVEKIVEQRWNDLLFSNDDFINGYDMAKENV